MAGIGRKAARMLAALSISAITAGTATAQTAPFEPSPDCLITASYAGKRFEHNAPGFLWRDGQFSLEGAILTWYIGGPKAIIEADDFNLRLWEDCFNPKSNVTCPGIRKDKRIAKAFTRPFGKLTKGDKKAIEKYFSAPPPDAAIRFAAQGIGRCFGDHPAQGTMEELGFRRGPFDSYTCGAAINNYPYTPGGLTFSGWDTAQDEHGANSSYGEAGRCTFIPEVALAAAEAADRKMAEEIARRESRTVEERIAGLNGCQIAYGLVTMGLGQQGGVSRVPDEAISWALKYETSVLENEACPVMAASLSDWLQAQPLDKFEAAEDPFAGVLRRKPAADADLETWTRYVTTVARHYETAEAPQVDLSGDLCPDFHTWLAQKHYAGDGGDDPLAKFMYSNAANLDLSLRPALCVAAPKWMYARYTSDRAVAATRRAAADAKLAQREAFMNSLEELGRQKHKPAYRPPASEPRCYQINEKSNYGTTVKVERCFN